jgi:hypothetical protein
LQPAFMDTITLRMKNHQKAGMADVYWKVMAYI